MEYQGNEDMISNLLDNNINSGGRQRQLVAIRSWVQSLWPSEEPAMLKNCLVSAHSVINGEKTKLCFVASTGINKLDLWTKSYRVLAHADVYETLGGTSGGESSR